MRNPDNIYKMNVIKEGEDELEKLLEEFKEINIKMKRKNKTRKRKNKHNKHNKHNKNNKHNKHTKKGGSNCSKLNTTRKQILDKF